MKLSLTALGLLTGIFPATRQKLEALGCGLVQQGDQASPELPKITPEPATSWGQW